MIYNAKEHVLFENDEVLYTLCSYYYIILDEITRRREPPIIAFVINKFKERFSVILSEEEYLELKDYAENEFRNEIPQQIRTDFETGRIREIK